MRNLKWETPLAVSLTFWLGVVMTTPAQAWSWPWQKKAPEAATQPGSAANTPVTPPATATQASAVAPAVSKPIAPTTAMTTDPQTGESSKVRGTVEGVDVAGHRLSLKTASGKTESFTLSASSIIFERHKKLTLSSLKVGEHVSVHCASGREASRVYVLEGKKA